MVPILNGYETKTLLHQAVNYLAQLLLTFIQLFGVIRRFRVGIVEPRINENRRTEQQIRITGTMQAG